MCTRPAKIDHLAWVSLVSSRLPLDRNQITGKQYLAIISGSGMEPTFHSELSFHNFCHPAFLFVSSKQELVAYMTNLLVTKINQKL